MTMVLGWLGGRGQGPGRAVQRPQYVDMMWRDLVLVLVPLEVVCGLRRTSPMGHMRGYARMKRVALAASVSECVVSPSAHPTLHWQEDGETATRRAF